MRKVYILYKECEYECPVELGCFTDLKKAYMTFLKEVRPDLVGKTWEETVKNIKEEYGFTTVEQVTSWLSQQMEVADGFCEYYIKEQEV